MLHKSVRLVCSAVYLHLEFVILPTTLNVYKYLKNATFNLLKPFDLIDRKYSRVIHVYWILFLYLGEFMYIQIIGYISYIQSCFQDRSLLLQKLDKNIKKYE